MTHRPVDPSTQDGTAQDQADATGRRISDVFADNMFSLRTMKDHLTESAYAKIKGVVLRQQSIDTDTAEFMAQALIKWAMDKGVTHYTHWFHPLTESSAEKHDAFFKPAIDLEQEGRAGAPRGPHAHARPRYSTREPSPDVDDGG